jgi:hypothetical protein
MKSFRFPLLAVSAVLACSAFGAALDFESNAKPSKWFLYPLKKGNSVAFSSEKQDNKSVLEIDFRAFGGHARIAMPQMGKEFVSVSFKVKGLPDAKRKSVDLMLVESDNAGAEKYYKTLKFNGEWQTFTLKEADFQIFPYGGSKIVDRKMDLKNLQYFQFNAYPSGSHFLISDINVEYKDAAPAK